MIIKFPVLFVTLAILFVPASNAVAREEADLSTLKALGYQATGESKRCVGYSRIRRTDVLDDYTILFHMAGGKTYVNILDYKCPRLGYERAIKYEVRGGTLCNVDHIEVISGTGFGGSTCRLGSFHEVLELEEETEDAAPTLDDVAQ